MTKNEILVMKPGSTMDELVAEKVMGWDVKYATHKNGRESDYSWSYANVDNVDRIIKRSKRYSENEAGWEPSTDISAAWEVVEKMDLPFSISKNFDVKNEHSYLANWCPNIYECCNCDIIDECNNKKEIICKTASEAICKAALLALGKFEEGEC